MTSLLMGSSVSVKATSVCHKQLSKLVDTFLFQIMFSFSTFIQRNIQWGFEPITSCSAIKRSNH